MSSVSVCRAACLAVLTLTLLAACRPGLTPEPDPDPRVLHVAITPTLNSLRPLFNACISEQPDAGLVVTESPAPGSELASLSLTWGPGSLPDGFAARLGEETLVFVVHPQNPLDRLALADLQAIYQGNRLEWPAGGIAGEVQPWIYPAGSDVQENFTQALGGPPLPSNVSPLAPDPAAMIEAVSGSPNAIGFLPRRWLDERVKEVVIEGLDDTLLSQPILAASQSEPAGLEKSWLLCLQEELAE